MTNSYKINLDKTIETTLKILNEEIKVDDVDYKFSSKGYSGFFPRSSSKFEIPIEHIGLFYLARESALDQVSTKIKTSNGQEKREFEFEDQGFKNFLANFLGEVSPDSLNWYKDFAGNTLRLKRSGEEYARPELPQKRQLCQDSFFKDGDDGRINYREETIHDAYLDALSIYQKEALKTALQTKNPNLIQQTNNQAIDDVAVFNEGFASIKEQAQDILAQNAAQSQAK